MTQLSLNKQQQKFAEQSLKRFCFPGKGTDMTGTVPFFCPEGGCGVWRGGGHVTTWTEAKRIMVISVSVSMSCRTKAGRSLPPDSAVWESPAGLSHRISLVFCYLQPKRY